MFCGDRDSGCPKPQSDPCSPNLLNSTARIAILWPSCTCQPQRHEPICALDGHSDGFRPRHAEREGHGTDVGRLPVPEAVREGPHRFGATGEDEDGHDGTSRPSCRAPGTAPSSGILGGTCHTVRNRPAPRPPEPTYRVTARTSQNASWPSSMSEPHTSPFTPPRRRITRPRQYRPTHHATAPAVANTTSPRGPDAP